MHVYGVNGMHYKYCYANGITSYKALAYDSHCPQNDRCQGPAKDPMMSYFVADIPDEVLGEVAYIRVRGKGRQQLRDRQVPVEGSVLRQALA